MALKVFNIPSSIQNGYNHIEQGKIRTNIENVLTQIGYSPSYQATQSQSIIPDGNIPINEQQALSYDIQKEQNQLFKNYIGLEKDKLSLNRNMGIASGFFQGLGSTVNTGLGIWGAIENSKSAKKSRELMDKQIDNYNEQIDASREARQQRRDEIARLNKMRSNTKKQFNTQASITRSY